MEIMQMATNRLMDKQVVVYLYIRLRLGNKRNKRLIQAKTWMNINIIVLNEKRSIKKEDVRYDSM